MAASGDADKSTRWTLQRCSHCAKSLVYKPVGPHRAGPLYPAGRGTGPIRALEE